MNPDQNLQCVKALCVSINGYMDFITEEMGIIYALDGLPGLSGSEKKQLAKAQTAVAMRLKSMQTSATALSTLAGVSMEHVMAVKS